MAGESKPDPGQVNRPTPAETVVGTTKPEPGGR